MEKRRKHQKVYGCSEQSASCFTGIGGEFLKKSFPNALQLHASASLALDAGENLERRFTIDHHFIICDYNTKVHCTNLNNVPIELDLS